MFRPSVVYQFQYFCATVAVQFATEILEYRIFSFNFKNENSN